MFLIALAVSAALSHVDPKAALALAPTAADHAPGSCHYRTAANGMPLPDPSCTPGSINPTLTLKVLTDPAFRTDLVRDKLTSAERKKVTYLWYGITPPKGNTGPNQTCELDHVIDLSAGGGDSLENVFPQCQRSTDPKVAVGDRWFKLKDRFAEHVMIAKVKSGTLTAAELLDLQKRIAADWTQFLPAPDGHHPGAEDDDPRAAE